jgi:hypothetical protein
MFVSNVFPVPSPLREVPVTFPVRVLLALPDYVTDDPGALWFNVPGAVGRLLGRWGPDRAAAVISSRIWAPGWTDEQLRRFVTSPFLDRPSLFASAALEEWRAPQFPGLQTLSDPAAANYPAYDIVHAAGLVELRGIDPVLVTGRSGGAELRPGALRDAMVAARTRLLILQVQSSGFDDTARLADLVAGGGGPAVVAVSARDSGRVATYLLDLYGKLVHNEPLPGLAAPDPALFTEPQEAQDASAPPAAPGFRVHLAYGLGSESILQFDRMVEMLESRIAAIEQSTTAARGNLTTARSMEADLARSVQAARARHVSRAVGSAEHLLDMVSSEVPALRTQLAGIGWGHESEGVMPLLETTEALARTENAARALEAVEPEELRAEVAGPARVLNANFADERGEMLDRDQPLVAGAACELLVDIGPAWDKHPSIVGGSSEFPTESLPEDTAGWTIDAVLISDDFEPHAASARIWLPRAGGRSHPFADALASWVSPDAGAIPPDSSVPPGVHPAAGPAGIKLRAPQLKSGSAGRVRRAHGRLSLYFENNLLQSAHIDVAVANSPAERGAGNTIAVDYVLSGSFRDLDRYAAPQAGAVPSASDRERVGLNITVNDDGTGGHRVIVKTGDASLPPMWTTIDPAALSKALGDARARLSDCYWEKDEKTGKRRTRWNQPVAALTPANGKNRNQFYWDLLLLAEVGRDLYLQAFGQGGQRSPDGTAYDWMREVRALRARSAIIQVARTATVPAQYVFPWALFYDHPLPGPTRAKYQPCPVIAKEWSPDGTRRGDPQPACPYAEAPDHDSNIICPYGFWGLKHIIEQPLSALYPVNGGWEFGHAATEIKAGPELDLAIGITRDTALSAATLDGHLARLGRLQRVRLSPAQPSADFDAVRTMLQAPQVVYFLCHGEYDEQGRAFLGVGPRDGDSRHRIYVTTLHEWAAAVDGLDTAAWGRNRPLVFINGCETAKLRPGEVLSFVTFFGGVRAGGVVGTEISVMLPVATEVAEMLVTRLTRTAAPGSPSGMSIGQAMREVRWELANKGNLLGLAYPPYGLADRHVVRSAPAPATYVVAAGS